MTEPLIYTAKGNLPLASLQYATRWEDNEDFTKFIETYRLGDEVVRESVHVMGKKQLDLLPQQGSF